MRLAAFPTLEEPGWVVRRLTSNARTQREPCLVAEENELTLEERQAIEALHDLAATGNYYALLGVSRTAPVGHIRKAYYELSRRWHPDRFYRRDLGRYKERLESVFVAITRAYSTLADPAQRDSYDQENADLLATTIPTASVVPPDDDGVPEEVQDPAIYEVKFAGRPAGSSANPASLSASSVRTAESPLTRKRRTPVPGIEKVRQQIIAQHSKARAYHAEALAAARDGNWVKAQSSIYLAMRFVATNAEYRKLYEEYSPKARTQLSQASIAAAETQEGYHNVKGAIQHYERACSFDPPMALPFFRLATLKQREEERDEKEILKLFRTAVEKEPTNVKYRLVLAQCFQEQGMAAAARREYQAILRQQPDRKSVV